VLVNNLTNQKFGSYRRISSTKIVDMAHSVAQAQEIKVCPHRSLDDDTFNSAIVINNWLKTLGKKVSVCYSKSETKGLFLNYFDRFRIKKADKESKGLKFVVDWNDKSKIPQEYEKSFQHFDKEDVIGLDHHIKTPFGKDTKIHINTKAQSCCEMVFDFLNSIKQELKRKDLERLYCGVLSDARKSKLINLKRDGKKLYIEKLDKLDEHKHTKEVMDKIEASLSERSKRKIYRHLDTISHLNSAEKTFRKGLYSKINVTENGKLAYVVIDPQDKQWAALGMDNTRTSTIIGDMRSRIVHPEPNDPFVNHGLKEKLKNVEGAIVFYRLSQGNTTYQMSMTTKGNYAERLINQVRKKNPDLAAGGHPDRAGGRILSVDKKDVDGFINGFLDAAKELG
jgi:nanoRNase/pAp phosphatase (c-di-AMP/oligoRNAs hydrolase)